jgi:flagellar assembly factor FliW
MKISTASFGPQDIDPDTIITFPQGLPGFDECKRFKLFHSEEYESLKCLQSLDDSEICFSLMEPILFGHEYEMLLSDEDQQLLKVENAEDLTILLMVYKAEDEDQRQAADIPMNTNWRSPIIINVTARIGLQKTLSRITRTVKISGA